jgi:peptide deformylase
MRSERRADVMTAAARASRGHGGQNIVRSTTGTSVVVIATTLKDLVNTGSKHKIGRMTIHRIRLLGDPILRTQCEPIATPKSTAVRVILDDMRETLRDWQSRFGSGRGIAAPQIGAPVRMLYIEMDRPWVLINPEIVDVGNEDFTVWDDCFSFPNLLVRVSRSYRIRIRYQDIKGTWHEEDLEGDRAELIQHELDHLDGVLAVDRPHGLDPFCLREEWNRLHAHDGRYGPPEYRTANYATQEVGDIL